MPLELDLGDVVRLRKPHPCGGYDWRVVRLGADIGLRCLACGRRVLLPRRELGKRLKAVIERASPAPGRESAAPDSAASASGRPDAGD